MTTLSREQLRVELYGGEDYRIYDGTRLVATVYAKADLTWLLDRDTSQCDLLRQREEEIERLKQASNQVHGGIAVPSGPTRVIVDGCEMSLSEYHQTKTIADRRAQLAARTAERAQDALDGQAALDLLNQQLAAMTADRDEQGKIKAVCHAHNMALENAILKLNRELATRCGWQTCKTHGAINADVAWGCPECVRELRQQLAARTAERDEHKSIRLSLADACGTAATNIESLQHHLAASQERCGKLEEALGDLVDHQNGCPLPKYEQEWNLAMAKAQELLRK